MINFYYIGIDNKGENIDGFILSENKQNAKILLSKRGYIVKSIKQKRNFVKNVFSNAKSFQLFVKSLCDLISSGLPLTDALLFISNGQAGSASQEAGISIFENIKNGNSLYHSIFEYFPKASKFHLSLIQSAEKSGNLEYGLKTVSDMIDEDNIKRSEFISALTYPLILFVSMLALIYFILEFVLPKMLNVMDLNNNLPYPTLILLFCGEVLPTLILLFFYGFIIISILIILRNRFSFLQRFFDIALIKIPFIKQIIYMFSRRIILQGYSLGLNGGLSIQEVSLLIVDNISNFEIKKKLFKMIEDIESGERFSYAIEKTNILDSTQIASIKIGDETDKLKHNFQSLKNHFEIKLSINLKTTVKIIEPLIIVIFGFIVLILALGIILPVLNTTSLVM